MRKHDHRQAPFIAFLSPDRLELIAQSMGSRADLEEPLRIRDLQALKEIAVEVQQEAENPSGRLPSYTSIAAEYLQSIVHRSPFHDVINDMCAVMALISFLRINGYTFKHNTTFRGPDEDPTPKVKSLMTNLRNHRLDTDWLVQKLDEEIELDPLDP